MSRRQHLLSHIKRGGSFHRVKGKGLIQPHTLADRFRRMNIGEGVVAHKQIIGEGTIRHHHRPHQLSHTEPTHHKHHKKYAPIHFEL